MGAEKEANVIFRDLLNRDLLDDGCLIGSSYPIYEITGNKADRWSCFRPVSAWVYTVRNHEGELCQLIYAGEAFTGGMAQINRFGGDVERCSVELSQAEKDKMTPVGFLDIGVSSMCLILIIETSGGDTRLLWYGNTDVLSSAVDGEPENGILPTCVDNDTDYEYDDLTEFSAGYDQYFDAIKKYGVVYGGYKWLPL
jgi:hypothetical protein